MTKIEKIIKKKEGKNFVFVPNQSFYDEMKINQKRWGQIYRGEIEPNVSELKSIAAFFEIPLTELI